MELRNWVRMSRPKNGILAMPSTPQELCVVDAALGIACEIRPTIRSGPNGLALPPKAEKIENRLLGPTNKIDRGFSNLRTPIS